MASTEAIDNVTVIESLCVNCEKNGETRLLLTRIPYFRDIVLASFVCEHCGYRNNEVQSASEICEMGERICLRVESSEDLDRQVVKSEHAAVLLPGMQFEIPAATQKGVCSTVQGIISQAASALAAEQPVRRALDLPTAEKLDAVIAELERLAGGLQLPFDFIVDDPAGLSFIENPRAPAHDAQLTSTKYARSAEQLHAMGFYEEQSEAKTGADLPAALKPESKVWNLAEPMETGKAEQEGISFNFPCAHCGKEGQQNMCEIDIPGFRKCIIMAFVCDYCGAKSNEVKPSGAYHEKARKWTLKVEDVADLSRDVLKSDVAGITIPQLQLELEPGTLGGVFTTIEGLLTKIAEELEAKFPFTGDSTQPERKQKMLDLVANLRKYAAGENMPFTIILDDAADHSHIGRRGDELLFLSKKATAPTDLPDHQLTQEVYERSDQQNEELGLKDMKTENY